MPEPTRPIPIPVVDLESQTEGFVNIATDEWKALLGWVEAHGLDPAQILASSGVTRDAERYRILYTTFVRDDTGRRLLDEDRDAFRTVAAVEQGEAPPLTFPEAVARLMHPMPAVRP